MKGSPLWLAFLLSILAHSILQLPRLVLAFSTVSELRILHARCYLESDRILGARDQDSNKDSKAPLLEISTRYCHHVYLNTLGRPNLYLEESVRLAQMKHLHDERRMRPAEGNKEQEMRRRVFWLLCE